ncbi:glycosyl hydrolase family 76-domain-containing protein [Fusarium oxysporum]|nr:glycosyl hydrolase family 76-domain-containing protein [Fusarium oxysporum]
MGIYEGVTIGDGQDCSNIIKTQWLCNTGIFLHGAAALYNLTESDTWKKRVGGMTSDVWNKVVKNYIINEQFCEAHKQCNQEQRSFKRYLAHWMAATSQVAPYTNTNITTHLKSSVQAAAKINAASILMYTLVDKAKAPVTSKTGGIFKGNHGGRDTNSGQEDGKLKYKTITIAEKAGAGILTLLIATGFVGGTAFLVMERCGMDASQSCILSAIN